MLDAISSCDAPTTCDDRIALLRRAAEQRWRRAERLREAAELHCGAGVADVPFGVACERCAALARRRTWAWQSAERARECLACSGDECHCDVLENR
jgi:hypothetical protein